MYRFLIAATPAENERVYRLRFQVYCLEKHYVQQCPDAQQERDEYDQHAIQFYATDDTSPVSILGCVRLILPNARGFPCETHFQISRKSPDPATTVEISRLIVAPPARPAWRHVLMGLIKEIYLYGREHHFSYYYAAMDMALVRILKRLSIPLEVIGDPSNYMGTTTPTMFCLSQFDRVMPRQNAWFYGYIHSPTDEQEDVF